MGMHLDIKHNMKIGKFFVVAGFLVTGLTYMLRRKENKEDSKTR